MKKLLTNFSALVVVCMFAHSTHGQISLGAKTGVNLNDFRQPGTTMGVNFGIYGSYQVNPFLTVKLEPHYSQEGGGRPDYTRYYNEISDNLHSVHFINPSVRFHNLQIPLLVEVTLPELTDQTIVPTLIVGASYAMALSTFEQHTKRYNFFNASDYDDELIVDVAYLRENVIDNYSRNQWSLWFGMGMKVRTGDRTFGFDVRYRHGLNNLNRLRFVSPQTYDYAGGGYSGVPGTGGNLYSSSLSLNFSMSIMNF
ncbi:MAG TPA: outer membrane beta-barrel protein [Chryseosolibacter sp.]